MYNRFSTFLDKFPYVFLNQLMIWHVSYNSNIKNMSINDASYNSMDPSLGVSDPSTSTGVLGLAFVDSSRDVSEPSNDIKVWG